MNKSVVVFIFLAVGLAQASTNDFLTWEECLGRTKSYSPELMSARAAVRELEYGVSSASSGFLPSVTASAGGSYNESEKDNKWDDGKSSTGAITLQQDLFSGGGNLAKRRRAMAQLEIGAEQYRKALSDVELRVRVAYVDVLYAQDLIELTQKIAERRANNVRLIQLRFDGGRENAGSLARSKAQLAQAGFDEREARRALDYALRNLAAAMGQLDPVPGAQGDLAAKNPDNLVDLKGLMEQTPSYSIAITQIEAAKQGVKVTRSQRFPDLRFTAIASANSSDYDNYNGRWSVGLNTSMPLFTGNQLSSDIAAGKEKVVQTEMDLLDTANTLMATLQQRWNSYMDSVESESVQKQLLDAEMLRAEISTAKYKQGLLSYEDWDIIESNLISQSQAHLARRRTAEAEQARWKNALGWSDWHTQQGE
ncbi:TolC family protein [Pontiella sulfatireligans]|uniref:Outer membrane protein TolC n=1 Tax=Pontiella sulfatireligans TaxID=2750658 RepID=A0A6C2UKN2_9BACT|nr:TolC family protein [Pontiella sulfatireligans]VGO19961.1 Outer membrane protein TolC [Pontiella sulfatireligans]